MCAATFRSLESSYETLLQKHADAGVRERGLQSQMTALQANLKRSLREKEGLERQVHELQREVRPACRDALFLCSVWQGRVGPLVVTRQFLDLSNTQPRF